MTDKLKSFFKNHLQNNSKNNSVENKSKARKWITYNEWGFQKAAVLNGNLLAFKGCLNLVKEHFLHEQGIDEVKKAKDIANAKTEIEKIDIEITNKENLIDKLKKKIEEWKESINPLKKEIIDIKENPTSIMKDKVSKVGFYIGLFILSALTIYLFIFYSSASYSGFFKDFTKDLGNGVASAIFDPQAIPKAFVAGVTEVILILTIPFVFLGLGYLIHNFQEGKGVGKYFKIGAMILITFAFDGLLAYKIEKGLYEVERINDPTGMMLPHQMSMAFESENFWLVIFAGFIVYIIWGFVFDFVMDAYDKLDFVKQAIKAREKQIKNIEDDIKKSDDDIHQTEEKISNLKKEKVEQEKIVSGATIVIDWAGFEKELLNFTSGWASWMTQNGIIKKVIDEIWVAREEFVDNHKKQKNRNE